MKSATTSLKAYGIYVITASLGFMFAPEMVFETFQLNYDSNMWTARLAGVLGFVVGIYNYYMGKYEVFDCYKITAIAKYSASLYMALFLTKEAGMNVILLSVIDSAFATWTLLTLKNTIPSNS